MWSYEGETGPEAWGRLDPGCVACGQGLRQSPINLISSTLSELATTEIAIDYCAVEATVEIIDRAVQVSLAPGCLAMFGTSAYDLRQFHFHTPGEHTVDGYRSPGELHLVHEGPDGALSVIGVMLEVGEPLDALDSTLAALSRVDRGGAIKVSNPINPADLLPPSCKAFHYDGSRTMPPCEEGVTWSVASEPVSLDVAQIARLAEAQGANSRPVQPWNGRSVGSARIVR